MSTELLEKYMAGDASQEEKESVQQWLEADERNRKDFRALRSLYDLILAHWPDGRQRVEPPQPAKKGNRPWSEWLKIAAAILITFTCSQYFFHPAPLKDDAAMQTLHVPAGQRAELTLADGTKVWLNSLTTFTFPDRFASASREVFLEGEAYFEVTHDETKPFAVHAKSYEIRVLGTEFNVSAYKNRFAPFEASLLKGSIEVVLPDGSQTIQIQPGSRLYEKDNQLLTGSIADYDHFLWKKGIISFENERMEAILNQLQLYYDITIQNENPFVKDLRYTGKFRTKDGIEHVLNVLKIPTGLRYHKDNEANFILIK
ncbi:MAG: FecR domain-containing protein [Tannerella sp.]|jgi:ferric-dicitrate binding protein FerR (iron transport regulator)|nr:FecR domain-containing protein [Tannerella sp.]